MCPLGQTARKRAPNVPLTVAFLVALPLSGGFMAAIGIIEVDHQSEESLLVNFTDGTFAFFSADDLVHLQPNRRLAEGDVAEAGQDYL